MVLYTTTFIARHSSEDDFLPKRADIPLFGRRVIKMEKC
jgi:hypothetical protein